MVILGSTGSIGEQTLRVASEYPERIRVVGLAANRNLARLQDQIDSFRPRNSVIVDESIDAPSPIRHGDDAVIEMVTDPEVDLVVVAVVGAAGLAPTLAALGAGKLVALANKEALVMAGSVIRAQVAGGGSLVPIDSEHSA
ncbi:MAG TPA: 1-deoxy-D-xylulose-5-phosphate reductoisomerase, partial [Chloroflexota bacterium]|nr:1-deoxy-D-xylulose-5-phosphate reductoisomerase [Chloroflexota bacterium]